jgi:hypothetical protein
MIPSSAVACASAGRADQLLVLEQLERPLPASWQEQQWAWDGCGKN